MLKKIQNILLYVYFFSINFQELKIFNLGFLSIPKVIAVLYIFFLLPSISGFFKISRINFVLIPIFSYFIFLTIVNILNISIQSYAFLDFTLLINIILFWFITIHFSRDFSVGLKAILCLALGSVLLATFYFFEIGVELDEHGRISIFEDNSNFVGLKMAISIILIFFFIIQNNLNLNWIRYLLLFPIPIMLKLLIDTGSRVSLISLVVMLCVGFTYIKKNGILMKTFLLFIFGGVIFFIYKFIFENPILLLRLSSSIEDKDLAGREVIYAEIWRVVNDNILFGIGQTGYFSRFGDGSPHNVFLEIICYAGIIGLLLYLIFLLNILKVAFDSISKNKNILPLTLFIPLLGLMLSGQILDLKLGWVILSFITSRIYFLKFNLG